MTMKATGFTENEDGAVTVDFVVLTAGIIVLCLMITIPLFGGAIGWGGIIADLVSQRP